MQQLPEPLLDRVQELSDALLSWQPNNLEPAFLVTSPDVGKAQKVELPELVPFHRGGATEGQQVRLLRRQF